MRLDTAGQMAAVRSRDPRFDGCFYLGVRSTGIYCRPSCPARVPLEANMRFYASAAAAQGAGYRACKRCRPDSTPGSALWHHRGDTVARAMRLIADGVVDREGVAGLAARVGYSTRQVERVLAHEVGAGPLALARAQRAQTARVLIETTSLPMSEVAHAAGFASIRSFNDTVLAVYASTPTALRASADARRGRGARAAGSVVAGPVTAAQRLHLKLPYRAPLHAHSLFGHLAATAVPGVEEWVDGGFARSARLTHGTVWVHLKPAGDHVAASLSLQDVRDVAAAVERCRRLLDLDADPHASQAHLAQDPLLAPLLAQRPGVRIPGAMDGGEMALRIVLSQHVSTAAAGTLMAKVVRTLGERLPPVPGSTVGWLFPSPAEVADADPALLPGMPQTRLRTLRAVAAALADGSLSLHPGADRDQVRRDLLALPGVGPWTAEMMALRCLNDPDAFPATDLGVRRTAAAVGLGEHAADLMSRSQRWRPWRAYVTQALWAASNHSAARMPASAAVAERPPHIGETKG
ncbi:MAG TPA: AlkA N-terminal domain-containing protein [Ornithinimicrobium sp.]|uniref:DNA-3-methyladenine glycosylase 2 family protein n=1 Tax=Ornithinimicrobium sp. TaxID=1977084 RepID=UPI002B492893|nr:AlkA N-terminal domain-containing protein [Ornithinimicrobium sp.]HKJ11258.1 AlkA N-terminal domain-containing protein [Ornithinimicrobium sp.]